MKGLIFKAGIFFLISTLALASLSSGAHQEEHLPDGIQTLKIGDVFQTEAKNIHSFIDDQGKVDYVWISPKDELAVNVELEKSGKIVRLAWHEVLSDSEAVAQRAKELKHKYSSLFTKKVDLDMGYAFLFTDKHNYFVVRFEGHMVTYEIISIASGIEVEIKGGFSLNDISSRAPRLEKD